MLLNSVLICPPFLLAMTQPVGDKRGVPGKFSIFKKMRLQENGGHSDGALKLVCDAMIESCLSWLPAAMLMVRS